MPQYSIKEVGKIVRGTFVQSIVDRPVSKLIYDSRRLMEPDQALFIAIKGKRHDGHLFIRELYDKGVRNFIVSESVPHEDLSEANIIKVRDSIYALQQLAAYHRKQFNLPVIGITGSNGKTVVKEWLNQLLEEDYNIVRSPKSYNSQIGVPLSVWLINENHTLGIFEAGLSQPGEMELLQKIIAPEIGIFTNIGEAHAEGFLNMKHKVKEKLRLFIQSKIVIYCKDYRDITQSISEIKSQFLSDKEQEEKFRLFTWSKQTDADLRISKIKKRKHETDIYGIYKDLVGKLSIPFTDEASIENAINCWAAMLYLGYEQAKIEDRMSRLGKISMRLELKDGINNCSIINDSYSSDIRSLAIALDFLNQQKQHDKKTIVLSDILQTGKNDQELYGEIKTLIEQKRVSRMIGIGKAISNQKKQFLSKNGFESQFYDSTDDFLNKFSPQNFSNETILLKGARRFEFERIGKVLEQKIHKTVLEIDLNALVHNLEVFNSLLKPETGIMAMVKAFSYGSGSFEIANILQYHLVDYLVVAYADEGVSLRKAGISIPIMVMNPEVRSFENMIRYSLEPEIYSFSMLNQFKKVVDALNKKGKPYPVHLKIDTGMHRLGFEEEDIVNLKKSLKAMPGLHVRTVFSHLSASEDETHDKFTKKQIALFQKLSNSIIADLGYPVLRHILNSGGIVRFPEAQYDMVRLGIGLYGIDTTGKIQEQLHQVSTLKSTISQIKTIKAEETVGYGRSYKVKKQAKIAVVGIGYADGIDRRLGNGNGQMLVRGKLAPLVGNICMDMCMLDVTDVTGVSEGDEVIVFGKELPIQVLAGQVDTIPYEVLTGVASRVKRIYFQE